MALLKIRSKKNLETIDKWMDSECIFTQTVRFFLNEFDMVSAGKKSKMTDNLA